MAWVVPEITMAFLMLVARTLSTPSLLRLIKVAALLLLLMVRNAARRGWTVRWYVAAAIILTIALSGAIALSIIVMLCKCGWNSDHQ
jgi:hypothetical protein